MRGRTDNSLFEGVFPSLVEKVRFLSTPGHYPGYPSRVQVMQTHMSYVFLTSRDVYKLKKPVHNHYFDFRTLEARRQNCEAEVQLNRRLAPMTYLGLVSLNRQDSTTLQLGGKGRVAEWLVHMRRLPTEQMLDSLILNRQLTPDRIDLLGRVLVDFYRRAEPVDITPEDYRNRYQGYVETSIQDLRDPLYELPAPRLDGLAGRLQRYLSLRGFYGLEPRAGRVVEAHGDLRPEHICYTHPPAIIDCLEFSQELRSLDPIEELSFLAIECERLQAGLVGERLLQLYSRLTEDMVPDSLIYFYKAYRCLLRAKLSAWHVLDDGVKKPEQWLERTGDYLERAEHYAAQLEL